MNNIERFIIRNCEKGTKKQYYKDLFAIQRRIEGDMQKITKRCSKKKHYKQYIRVLEHDLNEVINTDIFLRKHIQYLEERVQELEDGDDQWIPEFE